MDFDVLGVRSLQRCLDPASTTPHPDDEASGDQGQLQTQVEVEQVQRSERTKQAALDDENQPIYW